MALQRDPPLLRLYQDAARVVILLFLYLPALGFAAFVGSPAPSLGRYGVQILLFLTVQLLFLGLLREIVGRDQPVSAQVSWNPDYRRFLRSRAMSEIALHPLVRGPFWILSASRSAYLLLAGAEIAGSASVERDFSVGDIAFLRIGADSKVESGISFETTRFSAGRARSSCVVLGTSCLVGTRCILMPGVVLANEVRIEPLVYLGEKVVIGVSAHLAEGVRVSDGVRIGAHVQIGAHATIHAGAVIRDHAKIGPGAVIPVGEIIGEREIYPAPLPARAIRRVSVGASSIRSPAPATA